MSDPHSYVGNEPVLFAAARNWKAYRVGKSVLGIWAA